MQPVVAVYAQEPANCRLTSYNTFRAHKLRDETLTSCRECNPQCHGETPLHITSRCNAEFLLQHRRNKAPGEQGIPCPMPVPSPSRRTDRLWSSTVRNSERLRGWTGLTVPQERYTVYVFRQILGAAPDLAISRLPSLHLDLVRNLNVDNV